MHPFLSDKRMLVENINPINRALYSSKDPIADRARKMMALQKVTKDVTGKSSIKDGSMYMSDVDLKKKTGKYTKDGRVYGAVKVEKVWYLTGQLS